MHLSSRQLRDFIHNDPVWSEISAHLRANKRIVERDLKEPGLSEVQTERCRGQLMALDLILHLPDELLQECLNKEEEILNQSSEINEDGR